MKRPFQILVTNLSLDCGEIRRGFALRIDPPDASIYRCRLTDWQREFVHLQKLLSYRSHENWEKSQEKWESHGTNSDISDGNSDVSDDFSGILETTRVIASGGLE